MPTYLFWPFALLMLIGAVAVIAFRNPVSSALSVVASFVGLAALFIGLNAFFVGIIQILVYTGAIMVLFLFIIMLLDLKEETKRSILNAPLFAGIALAVFFIIQLAGILSQVPGEKLPALGKPELQAAASHFTDSPKITEALNAGNLPDVHLIGRMLFTEYNLALQILGVLLLVATVGVIALSKKQAN